MKAFVINKFRFQAMFLSLVLLSACAVQPEQDPLKNTKHLVKTGHKTLYENGAFHVPNTTVRLIPAGPDAFELASELVGVRAKQSLSTSISNAAQSFSVVSVGAQKTYHLSENIYEGGQEFSSWIREHSRPGSILLMSRAAPDAKYIMGESWEKAKKLSTYLADGGDYVVKNSGALAKDINREGTLGSGNLFNNSKKLAASNISNGVNRASNTLHQGHEAFINGYLALPDNLAKSREAMSIKNSWQEYTALSQASNEWRQQTSDKLAFYVKDSSDHYFSNVASSFNRSKEELNGASETGSLAVLKSLGWALHGVFWQGVMKPAAQLSAGSLGYVAVNGVVYPVVLVGQGAASLAELAVKVSWNSSKMAYDFVAPTTKAALAGLLATVQVTASTLTGGVIITGGTGAAALGYTGTQLASATVASGGYVLGKGIKYIGVPVAASGVVISGGAVGVAVAMAEVGSAAVVGASGEVVAGASQLAAVTTSGVTLAVGTTASVAVGASYGVYELSKAVVVPTGFTLGSGVVLGYGSLSQLAAHSVLAVSDASYMVLSMEGPNWVLYSVKGMLGEGEELVPGTVLNLEAMQSQGEEFKKLPISQAEMDKVIQGLPQGNQNN